MELFFEFDEVGSAFIGSFFINYFSYKIVGGKGDGCQLVDKVFTFLIG